VSQKTAAAKTTIAKAIATAQATQAWRQSSSWRWRSGDSDARTDRGLTAQERVKKVIEDFGSMLEAVRSANPIPFDAIAEATEM